MNAVPTWALEKARALRDDEMASGASFCPMDWAFAKYIAVHEEPPVDPILIEARKLADAFWPGEGALLGKLDNAAWTARLTLALKRGIELASKEPAL